MPQRPFSRHTLATPLPDSPLGAVAEPRDPLSALKEAGPADSDADRSITPRRAVAWGGLIWTLIRTDFKARYHGTLSGFVWALLKPLAMFAVLTAVFSVIFRSDPTYKLDLLVGLFLWDFFADGTRTGLTSLHAKGFLLSKARFPSWILVLTSISNAVITVAVFAIAVMVFLVATGRAASVAGVAAFLGYVVCMGALIVGFSLGGSVLFLRYRDLNQVWDVVVQAGFFVAPIIYPIGTIPERFRPWLYLWPPTVVVELARSALIDGRIAGPAQHIVLAISVCFVLASGTLVYRRLSPRAAEYL